MLRKFVLGIVITGFMLGTFLMPISLASRTIGTVAITVPTVSTLHAAPVTTTIGESGLNCAYLNLFCHLANFTISIQLFVSQLVVVVVGLILDVAISFSLDSASYKGDIGSFVELGWGIVRDFTNILFIFGLLVAAFYLILQPKKDTVGIGSDPKRIVVMVIVMALLVNFSLFFTKVIIDLGNIPARVFYDKLTTPQNNNATSETLAYQLVGSIASSKSVGLAIIAKVNPQSVSLSAIQGTTSSPTGWSAVIFYLFIALFVFVLNIVIVYIFAMMILIFLGRTFMLWLAMILSPLAFVLKAVPVSFLERFTFDTWLKETVSMSFLAPLFMFFCYLAITLLSVPISFITGDSIVAKIVGSSIKLIAVAFILLKGKTIAIQMSGELGQAVAKASGAIAAVGTGLITGGTGFLARQTLGRAGAAMANSKTLQGLGSGGAGAESKWGGTKFGKFAGRGADWMTKGAAGGVAKGGAALQKSSFDIRNGRIRGKSLEDGIKKMDKDFTMGNKFLNTNGFTPTPKIAGKTPPPLSPPMTTLPAKPATGAPIKALPVSTMTTNKALPSNGSSTNGNQGNANGQSQNTGGGGNPGGGGSSGGAGQTAAEKEEMAKHYATLGISPDATDAEVQSAYRKAANEHHPDKVDDKDQSVKDRAKIKFQEIGEAFGKIKNARGGKEGFNKGPKPAGPTVMPPKPGDKFSAFSNKAPSRDAASVRSAIKQLGPSTDTGAGGKKPGLAETISNIKVPQGPGINIGGDTIGSKVDLAAKLDNPLTKFIPEAGPVLAEVGKVASVAQSAGITEQSNQTSSETPTRSTNTDYTSSSSTAAPVFSEASTTSTNTTYSSPQQETFGQSETSGFKKNWFSSSIKSGEENSNIALEVQNFSEDLARKDPEFKKELSQAAFDYHMATDPSFSQEGYKGVNEKGELIRRDGSTTNAPYARDSVRGTSGNFEYQGKVLENYAKKKGIL